MGRYTRKIVVTKNLEGRRAKENMDRKGGTYREVPPIPRQEIKLPPIPRQEIKLPPIPRQEIKLPPIPRQEI